MSEVIQCPLNALEVFWVCEAFGELLVAAEVQEVNGDVEQGLEVVLERGFLQSCSGASEWTKNSSPCTPT